MKEKTTPELGLGNDVQVIRDILLGEHVERFQNQIEALEKEISGLKRDNKALRKELEGETQKRFQLLNSQMEEQKDVQETSARAMRQGLDARIQELEKRLQVYEERHANLVTALASALIEYGDKSGKKHG